MPVLVVTNPGEGPTTYEVTDHCLLGRGQDCKVYFPYLDSARVSRRHAVIHRRGDTHVLEDLGSQNGTMVNGQMITEPVSLADGDRISIGDVELVFRSGSAEEDQAATRGEDGAVPVGADPDGVVTSTHVHSSDEVVAASSPEAANRTLRALLDLLGGLGRSIEIRESLEHLLGGLFRIFGQADRGFVGVESAGDGSIEVVASKSRRADLPDSHLVSQTIIRRAMERREAVLSLDASQDPRFQEAKSVSLMRLRSVMCAPLVDATGEVLGVLQLDAFNPMRGFTPADLEVLASVAPQAAMALRYAQLHAEALERKTLDRDLELARRVQLALLPEGKPEIDGYAFDATYEAAWQVGGDFYDFVPLPDGRWAILVADASGKGVSAALLIAKLSGELRTYLSTSASGAEALERMCESLDAMAEDLPCRFVTLALLVLDPRTHGVEVVNAGHALPLLRHADGRVEEVGAEHRGPAIGMFPGQRYVPTEVVLDAGDVLLMFTDGFHEATNEKGEIYGLVRLTDRLGPRADDVTAYGERLRDDVEAFVAGARQSDDMCMICLGRSRDG